MGAFQDREPIVCACGDHAFVAITRGLTTMVSPEDAQLLAACRWHALDGKKGFRVNRWNPAGANRSRNLGAWVLGLDPSSGLLPDHINGDTLDNRRTNLRPATPHQNSQNRAPYRGRALPKGVRRHRRGRFRAQIMLDGREVNLGIFDTAEMASDAYRNAAIRHFGEFAREAVSQ